MILVSNKYLLKFSTFFSQCNMSIFPYGKYKFLISVTFSRDTSFNIIVIVDPKISNKRLQDYRI